ncbi:hypothetical protein [Ferrimonas marina]|uniref:Uncharacterized protein n=1 Tax=Ferrimonas marina TaxID=299255 RepID=A0A1M5P276_9GAMM|nr:hypothetical protein [Ferrimonas marina]SHG95848.1 hypothetical protein SAMN02745129_1261 [Ferrimonas marina]
MQPAALLVLLTLVQPALQESTLLQQLQGHWRGEVWVVTNEGRSGQLFKGDQRIIALPHQLQISRQVHTSEGALLFVDQWHWQPSHNCTPQRLSKLQILAPQAWVMEFERAGPDGRPLRHTLFRQQNTLIDQEQSLDAQQRWRTRYLARYQFQGPASAQQEIASAGCLSLQGIQP